MSIIVGNADRLWIGAVIVSSSFVKGERIATLEELLEQEYVMWCYGMKNTKVFHKGWFLSWQIAFAERQIQAGVLFKCRKKVLGKGDNTDEMSNNKSEE